MKELIIAVLFIAGALYGMFFLGQMKERHDYTVGFARQVEIAYWQGFGDGRAQLLDAR